MTFPLQRRLIIAPTQKYRALLRVNKHFSPEIHQMNQLMSDLSQNSIVVSPNKLWGKPLNLESGAFLKRASFKNTGKRDWGLQKVKVGDLTELVLLSFRSKKHVLLSEKTGGGAADFSLKHLELSSYTRNSSTVQEAHLLNPRVWFMIPTRLFPGYCGGCGFWEECVRFHYFYVPTKNCTALLHGMYQCLFNEACFW